MKSKEKNESVALTKGNFLLNLFTSQQSVRESEYKKAQNRLVLNSFTSGMAQVKDIHLSPSMLVVIVYKGRQQKI